MSYEKKTWRDLGVKWGMGALRCCLGEEKERNVNEMKWLNAEQMFRPRAE